MDRITWYTFFYKVYGNKETYLTFLLKVDRFICLKDFLKFSFKHEVPKWYCTVSKALQSTSYSVQINLDNPTCRARALNGQYFFFFYISEKERALLCTHFSF